MAKFYSYLARCSDRTLYAGYTTDLVSREKTHNEGKGARYTRIRKPIKFVYHEKFASKSEAMKREFQLKHLSKKDKESLISKNSQGSSEKLHNARQRGVDE